MKLKSARKIDWIGAAILCGLFMTACGHGTSSAAAAQNGTADTTATSSAAAPAQPASLPPSIAPDEQAPPASQTGGFDGQKAYDYTAKLVSFGPRPPASDAIHRTQAYITSQLKNFGCDVDTDDFHAPTPIGDLAMKNIVAKVPGTGHGIILLLTHYDTVRLAGFVGADDGGSSTGLMLEMASVLCNNKMKPQNSVWIAFLDGEEDQANFATAHEAQTTWNNDDTLYGSRELAARMDLSGDLKRTRAVILADMVGQDNLQIPPEASSTKWLVDLVWKTADRLGYKNVFVPKEVGDITDDHDPFLNRGVPSVDIIELSGYPYWHTIEDTMDKISPKSLAIVGYVILESISDLQRRSH